jgi:hypothetical protein|tara:strand:- start:49 stop:279 length:231 start_codon:yes stop_codon:yes gene_type:complete
MEDIKYVIINSSEVSSVDFSQVLEDSASTLRYNNNKTKTILKFKGETPSFLNGKTQYTNSEMLEQLETSEWVEEIQ